MPLIRRLFAALLALVSLPALAAQQTIITATPNSGNGDPLYTAFTKVNADFTDLYSFLYAPIMGPVSVATGTNTSVIGQGVVTNGNLANMPAQTVKCNFLSAPSPPIDCTATQLSTFLSLSGGGSNSPSSVSLTAPLIFAVTGSPGSSLGLSYATGQSPNLVLGTDSNGNVGLQPIPAAAFPNLSGAITSSGTVTAISADAVTNAALANMAPTTIKCNLTGVSQNPTDCTVSQINTMIGNVAGGTGSGSGLSNQLDLCTYPGVDATGGSSSVTGLRNAMAAVAGSNVSIYVNCPVKLTIGYDPTQVIFVNSGTNFVFSPTGSFLIDNNTIPAFVIDNVQGSTWLNPRIQYVGALTINNNVAPTAGVAGGFVDNYIKPYLVGKGYTFNGGSALWNGPTNMAGSFYIRGSSNNINFINGRFFVAAGANASTFFPVVFTIDPEFSLAGAAAGTASNSSLWTSSTVNVPTNLNFINNEFDGFYMGYTGTGGSSNIVNQVFYRYSDLQASDGSNPGASNNTGAGQYWFAPPHAMYLQDGDPSLGAHNHIVAAYDYGLYVGGATRRPATSGSLLSMKVSLTNGTTIDGYTSLRPDGCEDVIANWAGASHGNIRNFLCVFNSQTATLGGNVWAIRFPSNNPYTDVLFDNVTVIDTATVPTAFPIIGNGYATNSDVVFKNLRVFQSDWENYNPGFQFGGNNISVQAEYHYAQTSGTSTYLGPIAEQGTTYCTNCNWDVTLFGWRQFPVVFATAPASGATGGSGNPLVTPWQPASGTYQIQFSDDEIRYVTLTNGSTTPGTWTALTAAQTTTGNSAANALINNFNGYKPRIVMYQAGKSINTRAHIVDVSNGYEATAENGILKETWSQMWSGTPTGTSFSTPISFPTGMAIDEKAVAVTAGMAEPFNVGWSGSTSALFSAVSDASGTNPVTPFGSVVTVPVSSPVLITPTTGSESGGNVVISLRGAQVSASP